MPEPRLQTINRGRGRPRKTNGHAANRVNGHTNGKAATKRLVNGMRYPQMIVKRDRTRQAFDREKIKYALQRCFSSLKTRPMTGLDILTDQVVNAAGAKYK